MFLDRLASHTSKNSIIYVPTWTQGQPVWNNSMSLHISIRFIEYHMHGQGDRVGYTHETEGSNCFITHQLVGQTSNIKKIMTNCDSGDRFSFQKRRFSPAL